MYLLGEKDSPRMYTGPQYFQHFNGDIWFMIYDIDEDIDWCDQ